MKNKLKIQRTRKVYVYIVLNYANHRIHIVPLDCIIKVAFQNDYRSSMIDSFDESN